MDAELVKRTKKKLKKYCEFDQIRKLDEKSRYPPHVITDISVTELCRYMPSTTIEQCINDYLEVEIVRPKGKDIPIPIKSRQSNKASAVSRTTSTLSRKG